jgi:hypothetical protein
MMGSGLGGGMRGNLGIGEGLVAEFHEQLWEYPALHTIAVIDIICCCCEHCSRDTGYCVLTNHAAF